MKRLKSILLLFLSFLTVSSSYSQIRPKIINEFGLTAYAYFLTANRPGYGINAYVTEKGEAELTTEVYFNDEIFEIPLGFSYGIAKNFELSAGISAYSKSYNFIGNSIGGVGDSYICAKYLFQESEHFIHSVQCLVKIPTASKQTELGTGYTDLHFGIAESFYENRFGYDLSLELNLLHRRDYPAARKFPVFVQHTLDSIKQVYNYKYEPELVISGGPSYDISDRFYTYGGVSFSRNMKLKYNSTQLYAGFGYLLSNGVGLGIGGSYDTLERTNWLLSAILNISL